MIKYRASVTIGKALSTMSFALAFILGGVGVTPPVTPTIDVAAIAAAVWASETRTLASEGAVGGYTAADTLIDVSALNIGSYGANALSAAFTNPAGTVVSASHWRTSGTGSAKYLRATDYKNMIFESVHQSRDMEVDFWTRNGTVFLRLTPDGKAIYFNLNAEVNSIKIGIVVNNLAAGVSPDQWSSGSNLLYSLNMLNIPGYSKNTTENDYFTFGVDGMDIYAKFNGVEFLRFTDYRHMSSGKMGVKTVDGYGVRGAPSGSIELRHKDDKPLYSDFSNPDALTLDARDFGLKSLDATGTITAGSNQLALAINPGFMVGDRIIVAVGGEANGGLRGAKGVGGVWPSLSYSNLSAMQADTSKVNQTYAWNEENGMVYRFATGTGSWAMVETTTTTAYGNVTSNYYIAKAIPIALRAQITAISADGLTLTLSNSASANSTAANVDFDNANVLNKMVAQPSYDYWATLTPVTSSFRNTTLITPNNVTISIPVGDYAISEKVRGSSRTGLVFKGVGKDATTLFSPDGCPSAAVQFNGCPNSQAKDFHLRGNARLEGYGLNWWSHHPDEAGGLVTQTNAPQGTTYPPGVFFSSSSNCEGRNLKVTDAFHASLVVQYSSDTWFYDSDVISTEGLMIYVGWQIQWADSIRGGAVDCSFTSPKLQGALEAFKSKDVQFIRTTLINGGVSLNDAGGCLIKDTLMTVQAGSQPVNNWFYPGGPLINFNTNVGSQYAYMGATIENASIVVEGYTNSYNDIPSGITINANNPNVSVLGGSYTSPDWLSVATSHGAIGLNSVGDNAMVDGFRVIGASEAFWYNIKASKGTIKNCVADTIFGSPGVVLSNNQTN